MGTEFSQPKRVVSCRRAALTGRCGVLICEVASLRSIASEVDTGGWLAIAALIVALGSAAIAHRSYRLQRQALDDARRERDARALLHASFEPATFRATGTGGFFPRTLVIENTGERSSGAATVEFYVAGVAANGLCWEDEQNKPDRTRPVVAPGVRFTDDAGNEVRALRLDRAVQTITPSLPARLRVVIPLDVARDRRTIPVRVRVHAEHATAPVDAELSFDIIREGP